MNQRQSKTINTDAVFRTMREMLLEAPPAEVDSLAREAGLDSRRLAEAGRSAAESAIQQCRQNEAKEENIVLLHKGLNSLLIMLRRRDNLDENELALKATSRNRRSGELNTTPVTCQAHEQFTIWRGHSPCRPGCWQNCPALLSIIRQ
jgi:hypothetical protein